MPISAGSLRSRLVYEPQELKFGTSGRRGEVVHLTPLEIYVNALAELQYLQSLPAAKGGILAGDDFYVGYDLRPSSPAMCQAVVQAIRDSGMQPVNLGRIPTPALTYYALARGKGSIMVTGSHIPFDRNGYKLNTSIGELLKTHEEPINQAVAAVRERIYGQPFSESPFNERGSFKTNAHQLPPENQGASSFYLARYAGFFRNATLRGQRIIVYQHSAVGRDLLVELLTLLGAEVIPAGRSETFVPIDTENIDAEQLAVIQSLRDGVAKTHGPIDAIVSIDGDSDRPLILGIDPAGNVRFFPGDLVGIIVAEYLHAGAVVVPISSNDAIDFGKLAPVLEPKTRIGSPYVIAGMEQAVAKGRQRVCGWEANGGFLVGSDLINSTHQTLTKLATRDAFLPISCVLFAAQEQNRTLPELFAQLPKRYSRAALLRNFPRATSLKILEQLQRQPGRFFPPELNLGSITKIDQTDGIRMYFSSGEIVHIRPSGNADELRIYAVAATEQRADEIAAQGIAEPNGLLRQMEQAVTQYTT